jgi:hypothetical protein
MSRFVLVTAVVLGMFAFTAAQIWAADEVATQTKAGVIKSIDATAKTFVLKPEARELTFKITDATTYKIDGKEAKMAEVVKVDAKVTVTYTRSGDERTATKVEMTTVTTKG